MECGVFKNHFNENDCSVSALPGHMQKHLAECKECQRYFQFVSALNLQKGSLVKAPEDVLPNIEKKIFENVRQIKIEGPFNVFKFLFKPSFAASFTVVVFVAALSYAYMANINIGSVENLSKRFKLAQFENIKSGDMLYAGDNTTAVISLKSNNKFQIHQNTVVRVKGPRQIVLSRGEISLLSGDKELRIETPEGLFLAKNTDTKILTTVKLENGVLKTETTCIVLAGRLIIKSPLKEITLEQGQKVVLAQNGGITYQKQLAPAEFESEKSAAVSQMVFSAVQALCDCIYVSEYAPDKKTDHLQFFGSQANENKFKVHVFWKEKGLIQPGLGHWNGNNVVYNGKTRRIDAS
jgi:hypothetical protein